MIDQAELRERLQVLADEHRALDRAIDVLSTESTQDQLQLARLKRRKLRLKDEIAVIYDQLLPDIIA